MLYEILLFFFILGMVALLIYLATIRRRNIEKFTDSVSSYSLYSSNSSPDFDKRMNDFKDSLSDGKNLLHVYGCGISLGKAPNALRDYVMDVANGLYVLPIDGERMYANNFRSVEDAVALGIDDFYRNINKNNTIQGQVYAVISQAPYYRDDNNNPISLQYTVDQYGYRPTNAMKETSDIPNQKLKFDGYLIFTAYDMNGLLIDNTSVRRNKVLNIKMNFRQKEKMCFIGCTNTINIPCGCASQDDPYVSKCLDAGAPTNLSEGEIYTYAILYRVNPMFGDLLLSNKMTKDYSDYEWTTDKTNPPPTTDNPFPSSPAPKKPVGKTGVTIYQHCDYKGFVSEKLPVGTYTMDHIMRYFGNNGTVNTDVSALKVDGRLKVKLYAGTPENPVPINAKTRDGYITTNIPCFTRYKDLNDNLQVIEVADR